MSVIARRVAAIPTRTSVGTWQIIAELLAAPGSVAHAEIMAATNVAAMLIADEYTRDAAIVVTASSGPRVRIYTLHGDDAIDGDHPNETPLAAYPTDEAGWQVSLPCADAELDSVQAALGCGVGGDAGRSPKGRQSAEARRVVVDFVEDTARAMAAGLKTDVLDDGRKPDACSPPGDTHNWPYQIQVDVRGERGKKLIDDVAAYRRTKGHKVTTTSEPGAMVQFDGFSFGVHGSGPEGQFGTIIGGSSPCLPGPGSPVS